MVTRTIRKCTCGISICSLHTELKFIITFVLIQKVFTIFRNDVLLFAIIIIIITIPYT